MGNSIASITLKNKCAFDSVIPFLEDLSHRNSDKKFIKTTLFIKEKNGNNINVHKD